MELEKTAIEDTLQPLHLSIGGRFKISVTATLTSLLQNSGENQCCRYN